MFSESDTAPKPVTRKWDAEIDTARRSDDWIAFEAEIHQNAALRARVARALDRYGLGTSDIAVEEALDYLTRKELGQAARYFNRTGKAQFNQQQLTHAVLSYMSRKEQQRHITDATIDHEDHDHDDTSDTGSVRASHLPDTGRLTPDEYAARRDALRAIHAMVPTDRRDLYALWLALRENGERGERGTLAHVHAYANRHGIGLSTVYFRMKQLADTIQQHPWFEEITAPFQPLRRAA
jgi:hypothetical protein